MNDSQWPDQSRMYSDGSAKGKLISLTGLNRDAGDPVSERNSGSNSPSTVRKVPPTAKHRGCAYTLYSWFPEFLCCILGILALIGQIGAPLRVLAC
jgi:hypothetical protein